MGVLTTGNTFSTGDQVTASKLNDAINSATLQAAAVDNTSTQLSNGAIIVKDLGITQGKIASDAVGTNELANDVVVNTSGSITTTSGFTGSVTGNVTGNLTGNVAGNVTGGTGSFTTLAASGDVTFDTTTLKVDSSNNRVGIGTASPEHKLSVFEINDANRTEIGIDNQDQRLILGAFFEQGQLQYGTIQSTNNAENGATPLLLQPDGGNVGIGTNTAPARPLTLTGDAEINVSGASNSSKAIVINSSGTNFESDAGLIQGTHAGSGAVTGGYWLKFKANSADKFSVRGDGRTEISSTTGGVIMPRMTTTQKNAISSPTNGEMVYDTTENKFYGYANGSWVAFH